MPGEFPTLVPALVMHELNELAAEATSLGDKLAKAQRNFEPAERAYDDFVTSFVAGLWQKHLDGEIKRMPGEDIRLALAHKAIPPETYGQYLAWKQSIARLEQALRANRTAIDAKRSVLSALKLEQEAVR